MKKIIVATHHELAKGLKSTFNYIAPDIIEIIEISAYLDNISVENQVREALQQFNKDQQVLVFTDLLGGSVNQEFVKYLSEYNIKLISGVNLPLLLTLGLSLSSGELSEDNIRDGIEEARKQLVYVNDVLLEQEVDDLDE